MPELLLEIGCEELPAGWLAGITEQLARRLEEAAAREHLAPSDVRACSTPRRLIARADVLGRQPDREERSWGPSLKVAKDAKGQWSSAAQGFARKNGLSADALQQGAKDPKAPDDLYVFVSKQTPGRSAGEMLPGAIAAALRGLNFPKRMSWDAWLDDGKGALPFGRPIRWLVALLGGEIVPFEIRRLEAGARGGVLLRSGDATLGHRFLPQGSAGQPLKVASFTDLRERLRDHFVLIHSGDRLERIQKTLEPLKGQGVPSDPHHLVSEWQDLVEYPTVVTGTVPVEFRTLPRPVLETVLVHHQKYIPLTGSDGTVERFAAVTNGFADASGDSVARAIVRNMERVVVARLRDAAFFWAEDLKRTLPERVADLAGVTFHQALGSYKEKTDRMVVLVDRMGEERLLADAEHRAAREAALLCKADLTTAMVREFPELQGVMGGIYLAEQGYGSAATIKAVSLHYLPVLPGKDSAPHGGLQEGESRVFAAVSMADKLDTLAGYFGIGLVPRGSSDPYGLRRAAQGVVRLLLDFWNAEPLDERPDLREQIAAAVRQHERTLKRSQDEVCRELEAFFLERIRYVLGLRGALVGITPDEVDAVLGAREPDALEDPLEAWRRLESLHRVRAESHEDFAHLAVAFKRAKNILTAGGAGRVDPGLLHESAERELHAAVSSLGRTDGGYEARLRSLAGLRGPVDRFFDDVLVMAEDPKLKANRLGLLSEALALFYRIADISKLGGQA